MPVNSGIIQRVKGATVAIARHQGEVNPGTPFVIVGSGFCIDPCGIIVTCRHVVDPFLMLPTLQLIRTELGTLGYPVERDIFAVFYSQHATGDVEVDLYPMTHIICKTDHDLALLRIDAGQRPLPFLDIASPGDVLEGEDIGLCGFPLGNDLLTHLGTVTSSFSRGIVSSFIPGPGVPRQSLTGYQLDASAIGGNSGGPAFLWNTGKAFGVLQKGVVQTTLLPTGNHQIMVLPLQKAAALHHLFEPFDFVESLRLARQGEQPPAPRQVADRPQRTRGPGWYPVAPPPQRAEERPTE